MSDDPDCLGMCQVDDGVCSGCGRSVEEIAAARAAAEADGGDDLQSS